MPEKQKVTLPGFPWLEMPPGAEGLGFTKRRHSLRANISREAPLEEQEKQRLAWRGEEWFWDRYLVADLLSTPQPPDRSMPDPARIRRRQACTCARCLWLDEADRVAIELERLNRAYDNEDIPEDFVTQESVLIKAIDHALAQADAWRKAGDPEEEK